MFADADLTRTTDKRILKGYSIDDIDKESLRQYRQLFNIAKPDHVWSTLSDMDFLRQLGAYRLDRRTREEGFTVAGILMFGKGDAITDDECLPNFSRTIAMKPPLTAQNAGLTEFIPMVHGKRTFFSSTYALCPGYKAIFQSLSALKETSVWTSPRPMWPYARCL